MSVSHLLIYSYTSYTHILIYVITCIMLCIHITQRYVYTRMCAYIHRPIYHQTQSWRQIASDHVGHLVHRCMQLCISLWTHIEIAVDMRTGMSVSMYICMSSHIKGNHTPNLDIHWSTCLSFSLPYVYTYMVIYKAICMCGYICGYIYIYAYRYAYLCG